MAVQLTLTDISSGYQGSDIQANFTAIEDEFDKVLYRNGDLTVTDTIDMNSQRLVNLPAPTSSTEPLRKDDQFTSAEAQSFASDAETAKDDAETALFNFQDHWLGPSATEPTQDGNGNALEEGDLYFDTDNDVLKAYDGTDWVVSANQYFSFVNDTVTANEDELNLLTFANFTDDQLNDVLSTYETDTVELGGDFSAGEEVVCERIANTVTITATNVLGHSSLSGPSSTVGVVPASYRPNGGTSEKVYRMAAGYVAMVRVTVDGTFELNYKDWDGLVDTRTDSATPPSISFLVT